jgi:hypothetical protein
LDGINITYRFSVTLRHERPDSDVSLVPEGPTAPSPPHLKTICEVIILTPRLALAAAGHPSMSSSPHELCSTAHAQIASMVKEDMHSQLLLVILATMLALHGFTRCM